VILFFDEFDILHCDAAKAVCSSVLATFRTIRNDEDKGGPNATYIIHSIVTVGTFYILMLNQKNDDLSPFNSSENFDNVSLTETQVQELFKEFEIERNIIIEADVIKNIFLLTNGHAGLVNVCGKAIDDGIVPLLGSDSDSDLDSDSESRILRMDHWRHFSLMSLRKSIMAYGTFDRMVDSLTEDIPRKREAIDYLQSCFLGKFDKFVPVPFAMQHLAAYLAAQGVLYPDETAGSFRMTSPIVDSLIRQIVIPRVHPSCPSIPAPLKDEGGIELDILTVLTEALKHFDQNLIFQSPQRSYKEAKLRVDGRTDSTIPRESVYNTELMRILTNWLTNKEFYKIDDQWHLFDIETDVHKYNDIVISKGDKYMVLLELLATGDNASIRSHINKTFLYKKLLSKDHTPVKEAWIIHFTREDKYRNFEDPFWQSDDMMNQGVYLVHFWHNKEFTDVRMSARWMDSGNARQVNNVKVI